MPRNMDNSNPRLLLSEILRKVSNAKTKKEKVELLRKHNSNALRQVLIINFDESNESVMPEGDVPYTPNDAPIGTDHSRLEQEYRGLYRFVLLSTSTSPLNLRECFTNNCFSNAFVFFIHPSILC